MKKIRFFDVENFKEISGMGVSGKIANVNYFAGKLENGSLQERVAKVVFNLQNEGKTVVVLYKEKDVVGVAGVADVIKSDAKETISKLKDMGYNPMMLTGDNRNTAEAVANQLGIKDFLRRFFLKIR